MSKLNGKGAFCIGTWRQLCSFKKLNRWNEYLWWEEKIGGVEVAIRGQMMLWLQPRNLGGG